VTISLLSILNPHTYFRDQLERGQAPLPDLFYSQLRKRRVELEPENKTGQEEGLAPLVEKELATH